MPPLVLHLKECEYWLTRVQGAWMEYILKLMVGLFQVKKENNECQTLTRLKPGGRFMWQSEYNIYLVLQKCANGA